MNLQFKSLSVLLFFSTLLLSICKGSWLVIQFSGLDIALLHQTLFYYLKTLLVSFQNLFSLNLEGMALKKIWIISNVKEILHTYVCVVSFS